MLVAVVVAFAQMWLCAWVIDRTPARQREMRPLAPLVALAALTGAIACGLLIPGAEYRAVTGRVTRRFTEPIKTATGYVLQVTEADGATVELLVPQALWEGCALGDRYAHAAFGPERRCGPMTVPVDYRPPTIAAGLWAATALPLVLLGAWRCRRADRAPLEPPPALPPGLAGGGGPRGGGRRRRGRPRSGRRPRG